MVYRYLAAAAGTLIYICYSESDISAIVSYTRIVSQLLLSNVTTCDLVDKQLLNEAYQFIYNSCNIVQDNGKCFNVRLYRKPINSLGLEWEAYKKVALLRAHRYDTHPTVRGCFEVIPLDKYIVKSGPPAEEIHSFKIVDLSFSDGNNDTVNAELTLAVQDTTGQYLLSTPIASDSLVTLNIYGKFVFLKLIDCSCNMVVSTFSVTGNNPQFSVCIRRPAE